MGRFHVGAAEDDHDEHGDDESSSPVVAVSATSNPTVESMNMSNKTNGADADNNNNANDNDEVLELVGSEPWEDRCYADADADADADDNGREPVSTPPPLPASSSSAAAVVPYENGHGDYHSYHEHEQDDADPDRAAAEELAAQMDRQYRYEQQEDEEERRERQARIDTRIRMLWGGRGGRRRGEEERRVYGHVLGSGGDGGDAPPYAANIYGHGYGGQYYHGGPQPYHEHDDGAMMYHANGAVNLNSGSGSGGLLRRLRRTHPVAFCGLLAVLSGLVLSYLVRRAPPPPPPHDGDWTSYIVTSTHRILGEVERASHDAGYIVGGFGRNMYRDAVELVGGLVGGLVYGGSGGPGGCVLRIPTSSTTVGGASGTAATFSYIERRLREDVFGQDRAVRAISRALEAWEGPGSSSPTATTKIGGEEECAMNSDSNEDQSETCKPPSTPLDSNHFGGEPLTLLLSGPEGTGKRLAAGLVARLVFEGCSTSGTAADDDYFQRTMPGGVLHIDGRAYADGDGQKPAGYAYHQRTRAFGDRIIGHIQRQRGAGAVIIISQVEDLAPSFVGELVRMIQSASSADLNNDVSNGRVAAGEGDKDAVRWNNVLFILTSYLGADKMFQLIHVYEGIELISDKDLTSAVRNDVDDHFGSSTGLGNAINTIATFMPLEVEQMEDVLDRKVRQLSRKHEGSLWKRLDVTERALSYFAGLDHIEYLSMKNRETGSTVFSFSKRGAHTLDDDVLLQSLRSARRHMPARPHEVAVFDYDLNKGVATVTWCVDNADNAEQGSDRPAARRHRDLSAYDKCGDVGWRGEIR